MKGAGQPEVVIVGGGIAGASLATVLARSGREVMVLERQPEHRDRVRGEYLANWGVREAEEIGLEDVFRSAGSATARYRVGHDEHMPSAAAASGMQDTADLVPGVEGGLCASHPGTCRALLGAARRAGAEVVLGVSDVRVLAGRAPSVTFRNGSVRHVRPRLVVGADGRSSAVRKQVGIKLHRAAPSHLITGMLVEGMSDWPADRFSAGTEGNLRFLIFPQAGGRLRLYTCSSPQERMRWAGADGPRSFLEAFASLRSLPGAVQFRSARVAGPCATFTSEDTWTESPLGEGVVLLGDAAGYNDPIIGQGLSLAVRDVRVASETLLHSDDWSEDALMAFAQERGERLKRQRRVAATYAALFATFTDEARARRKRFLERAASGDSPTQVAFKSIFVGPYGLPKEVFTEEFHRSLLAS